MCFGSSDLLSIFARREWVARQKESTQDLQARHLAGERVS
jgi:hypothetical protein